MGTFDLGKTSSLVAATRALASEVALTHADAVDAEARFPVETFEALRKARLLSAAVPAELGGGGAGLAELSAQCAALAAACGSSGMVLAMHHIQVACLARHGLPSPFFRGYLAEVAERQLLLGSITSEVGTWGDTRSSVCAVAREGDRFRLDKEATTGSYAEAADALLVTARRGPDAPGSDQVLALLRREDRELTRTTTWDTLGMRGTVSPGFRMTAAAAAEQILPGAFADCAARTMVPYSHTLWAALWYGIAADAVARAAAFVRFVGRRNPGTVPPAAHRLAEVEAKLQAMRHDVVAVATEVDALGEGGAARLLEMGWALRFNNLKLSCSEAAPAIVGDALRVIGIQGYKNDSPYAVTRHLRDALSAPLMIGNDRIAARSAAMLLVFKDD
jgi:acyl-CoA dehydrogenase